MVIVCWVVICVDVVLVYQFIVQVEWFENIVFYEGLIWIIDEMGCIILLCDFMLLVEMIEFGCQIDCLVLLLGLKVLVDEFLLWLLINMLVWFIGYLVWLCMLCDGIGEDVCILEWLILEIIESLVMGMLDVVGCFMQELQVQGVSFVLDDFGVGYILFCYLCDFCFDMIKIDGQFIWEICIQCDNQVLMCVLQVIVYYFDMFIVVELVEMVDDVVFLIDMGIDCLQGYYFGVLIIVLLWCLLNLVVWWI